MNKNKGKKASGYTATGAAKGSKGTKYTGVYKTNKGGKK